MDTMVAATREYERWVRRFTPLVPHDIARKHAKMREDPFSFLRATFYRWAQRWPAACPDLVAAPHVLAIGDLHIENFGTWRDPDGRLVWGVNDFDEAGRAPYTNDLVRLVASAWLARDLGRIGLKRREICDTVLLGYREGLRVGGRPFVLAEHNGWLGQVAAWQLREPVAFWRALRRKAIAASALPADVHAAVHGLMPERQLAYTLMRRIAGLGSLGRPRFVALAKWKGGWIAREARALVPSAYAWLSRGRKARIWYETLNHRAVRSPDPFLRVLGRWVVRRLAPDCSKIDIETLPTRYDESRLLHAMGYETANIHMATRGAREAIRRDLRKSARRGIRDGATTMLEVTLADWKAWKRSRR